MDINNNLQQINTFTKGMNTDVSDMLMDSSQYRYAENVRLVTNTDSNSGELRLVDGTTEIDNGNLWTSIIAMTSIRNYVIVIAETQSYEGNAISIFRNTYKDGQFSDSWKCFVKNLPYGEYVQDGEQVPHFSLTTRWESDNNVKLYIADGIHNIISLNITEDYTIPGEDNTTEQILSYANTELDAPSVQIIEDGTLPSAKVQYGFRLYNSGQPATQISPLSRLIAIYKNNNEGYEPEEHTNKAAKVTIPQVDNDFERIQIYRISYVILGQEPTVALVYDGDLIPEFIDRGGSVSQLGVEEFVSLLQLQIVPAVIESKNDYLFAANLKYKQDEYDKELEDLDFRSYSYGDWDDVQDAINKDYSKARDYNAQYTVFDNYGKPQYNEDYWKASEQSLGGFGPIVQWQYVTRRVLIDEHNNAKWITSSGLIQVTDSIQSLRRGEIYRYGIILYKKGGTKSSVKWIADIMAPSTNSNRYISFDYPTDFQAQLTAGGFEWGWKFTVLGIKFTVYTSQLEDCSGFEIVRCKRGYQDVYTISQGIIGIPERTYKSGQPSATAPSSYIPTEIIHPNGYMTTQSLSEHGFSATDNKYLMFASPEYAYQPDDIKDVINGNKGGLYLQDVQSFYNPAEYGAPTRQVLNEGSVAEHWYIFAHFASISDGNTSRFKNQNSQYLFYRTYINDDPAEGPSDECHFTKYTLSEHASFSDGLNDEGEPNGPCIESRSNGIRETSMTNVVASKSIDITPETVHIKEFGFPEVPSPQEFIDDSGLGLYRDAITTIGSSVFNGWTAWYLLACLPSYDEEAYNLYRSPTSTDIYKAYTQYETHSTTGKCIVFETSDNHSVYVNTPRPWSDTQNRNPILAPITVADLKKQAVPYGGPETSKSRVSDYFSHGYYVPMQDAVAEVYVYDGDCHPGIFVYHAAHCFDNSVMISARNGCVVYYVPVESDIDLRSTYGDLYTRVKDQAKSYYVQDTAIAMSGYVQDKRAYLCNTAYNAEPDILSYSTADYTSIDSSSYDYRIHHSELKTNNERVDSWSQFKPLNYIDVDTRFGQITNMRLFKDKLLYWQSNATGVLSVNERTVLNDIDQNEIVLGTGGVLQRYDYISTLYGMKPNQYEAEIQSNTTQYWWDGYNKEILAYAGGMELTPLTKIKNVQNYINSYSEVDRPSLSYDLKYNELISNAVNKHSIIYNEQVQQFTSLYTFSPIFRVVINNDLLLSPFRKIYKWNSSGQQSTLFGINAVPKLKYVVNKQPIYNKVFDITTFGGRFYGGGAEDIKPNDALDNLTFKFSTPLKQNSEGTGRQLITNREYDFRLAIPRNANSAYGDRMRGKTMQCELSSSSNSTDFSLQYIITKFRMSWS